MRTMKDKERFLLIIKIFLDINGPATSIEIAEYMKQCPVKLQKEVTALRIAMLLRGQSWIKKERKKNGEPYLYEVIT